MLELKGVIQSRAVDGGHSVEIDLAYSDDSKETIKCSLSLAASLILAINQAATVGARMQQAQPGQTISTEVPLVATDVGTATSARGRVVAFRFPTTIGTPIVISMTEAIARQANEKLSKALLLLDTQPPFRPS